MQLVIGLTVFSALFSIVVFNFTAFMDEPSIYLHGYNIQVLHIFFIIFDFTQAHIWLKPE